MFRFVSSDAAEIDRSSRTRPRWVLTGILLVALLGGCAGRDPLSHVPSPAKAGLNTRDLVDLPSQIESDRLVNVGAWAKQAQKFRLLIKPATLPPKRSVLCLSGGGSYGAYSAGVLYGWTGRGDRPQFDVVTGISTGALMSPFAFLGSKYDEQLKEYYTSSDRKDLYKLKLIRGLFGEAITDTSPLVRKVEASLTPEVISEIAIEHAKGRRLYVGTTEMEGKRFVYWDIGAIAARGTPEDVELIKLILLGSSAIPGFFPPAKIPVEVDGQRFVERHVDGGVSQALFFRPPYVAPEFENDPQASLYGIDVFAIVAGKLFADAEAVKPRSLKIAATNVSTIIFAQTRNDLTRLWTVCQLTGMNFFMASIPTEAHAPKKNTVFKRDEMTELFNEGVKQMQSGAVWRTTPPGADYGESALKRSGTKLTYQQRGPKGVVGEAQATSGWPLSQEGIPAPLPIEK